MQQYEIEVWHVVMQDLPKYQLLGAYNGEVLLQSEYDANVDYDLKRGDNLKDDKTKTLWEDPGMRTHSYLDIFVPQCCNLLFCCRIVPGVRPQCDCGP